MHLTTALAVLALVSSAYAQYDPDTIFRGPHPFIDSNDIFHTQKTESADLNGDGILDLISMQEVDGVIVKLGIGDRTFGSSLFLEAPGGGPAEMAIGDVDGDTHIDIAVQYSGQIFTDVSVFRGIGDGTFEAARRFGASDGSASVAIGDLNGDGPQTS